MHEVLVNRLGGLSLPRKSVVRLTDRPDMTLDFYRGRKTTIQQQQQVYLQEQNVYGSLMTPCVKYRGSCGSFRGSYFHGGCLQVFHKEVIIINNILMFFIRIASV